ncbi:hypothetical protein [Cyanothece sp. BG0011]|uniref:hypothetical protein n=1 Tax=Cyanothece sp. BG0011 TaxID=2082950 RepID=UPI000D1FB9D6|nr:hypothetical protein [Cyanothece sp. BG0011]
MDDQLNLFDNRENESCYRIVNRSYQDWEIDANPELFDNSPNALPSKDSRKNDQVFDNNNIVTEKAVSEYQPGGTASRSNKYYRFSYRKNNRVKHIHIKGGNTCSKLAIKRKQLIEAWIKNDIPVEKIIEWIKEW